MDISIFRILFFFFMAILNLTSIQLRESHSPILKINVNHLAQILKLLVARPTFLVDIRFSGQFRITVDINVSERLRPLFRRPPYGDK